MLAVGVEQFNDKFSEPAPRESVYPAGSHVLGTLPSHQLFQIRFGPGVELEVEVPPLPRHPAFPPQERLHLTRRGPLFLPSAQLATEIDDRRSVVAHVPGRPGVRLMTDQVVKLEHSQFTSSKDIRRVPLQFARADQRLKVREVICQRTPDSTRVPFERKEADGLVAVAQYSHPSCVMVMRHRDRELGPQEWVGQPVVGALPRAPEGDLGYAQLVRATHGDLHVTP